MVVNVWQCVYILIEEIVLVCLYDHKVKTVSLYR